MAEERMSDLGVTALHYIQMNEFKWRMSA